MYCAEYEGVLFVEGDLSDAQRLGELRVKVHGIFSQAQLKSLDAVKSRLADAVRAKGGNALVQFKYGQRSRFLASLIGLDDVSWYGAGVVAMISEEKKRELILP